MTQDPLTLYKLIILYMLDHVNFKMTYSQLSSFILEKEYTNYITLQQVLSDLQESELIKADSLMNRTYLSITAEGQRTLSYFKNRIGEAITDEIDCFLAEKRLELEDEASLIAIYSKTQNGGYEASLIAIEKDVELVSINLSVPSKEMAENICNNWYRKNQQIYKYLMGELF